MVTLELPLPPSVNAMFRNVAGRGRVKTKTYKMWIAHADCAFLSQKRAVQSITGPYKLTIHIPQKMRGDADNRIKGVSDWLVSREITPDDRHCQEFRIVRSPDLIDGCRVELEAA